MAHSNEQFLLLGEGSEAWGRGVSCPPHRLCVCSRDCVSCYVHFIKNIFFNVYFWETETEHEWGRGRERRRHRIQSRLQALSCQHKALCGAQTHWPQDHDLNQSQTLNQLSHLGASHLCSYSSKVATNHMQMNVYSYIPIKLYLQKQAVSQTWTCEL